MLRELMEADEKALEHDAKREVVAELSYFEHVLSYVSQFNGSEHFDGCVEEPDMPLNAANCITSRLKHAPDYHTIMLDLDVPAKLIPSSTEGNSHLYIDVLVPWEKYEKLLEALADCGVIEDGYAGAAIRRKHTTLRLPWVKKSKKYKCRVGAL